MIRVTFPRLALIAAALLGLAATGCQHNAAPSSGTAMAAPNEAVIAGKTTFIRVPNGQGQYQVVAYSAPGTAVCKDCQATAEKYFLTGKLDHTTCPSCGSTIYVGQSSMIHPH